MWTDRVAVSPPEFRHDLGFFKCVDSSPSRNCTHILLGDPKFPTGVEHRQAFAGVELNRP